MNYKLYTFEEDLSEREFLKRELNLELIKIQPDKIHELTCLNKYGLATSKIDEIEDLVTHSKDNSIVLFYFGNETYNVSDFHRLNKHKTKIRMAYFQMLPQKTSFKIFLYLIPAAIYDGALKFNENSNFFRQLKNGFDLLKRCRKIRIQFQVVNFPQGYSNRFVNELDYKYPNLPTGSLINFFASDKTPKTKQISFVGQKSNWNRNFSLNILKSYESHSSIVITEGWAGALQGTKTDYLDHALESKFIWNPPGNITNRTHRYLETLICGGIPLLPPATLQDPQLWDVWSESCSPKLFSWRNLIKFSLELSEFEFNSIMEKEALRQEILIEELRSKVHSVME